MKDFLVNRLMWVAKPLLGKGIIDRHAPFLLDWFSFLYIRLQKESIKTVPIPLGIWFSIFSKDPGIGLPLLLNKQYEPLQTKLFLETVTHNQTVLDIGANVGYYTLLAGKKVGDKGNVFAFEPDEENHKLLLKNIKNNNLSSIHVYKKAISSSDGVISFDTSPGNKGNAHIATTSSKETISIPSQTLDSFLKEAKLTHIDVIKIDIEGAEIDALSHASRLKEMKNVTLFIEYNPRSIIRFGNTPETLLSALEDLGFTIVSIIDEAQQKTVPFSLKNLKQVLSKKTYTNLLCRK